MEITVRLLASYRRFLPEQTHAEQGYSQTVEAGSRVADLLQSLPIPPAEVYTFFVNGRHADLDQALQDGDVVSIFPAAGGG
jgi:molybdopterin converting factor small subunit